MSSGDGGGFDPPRPGDRPGEIYIPALGQTVRLTYARNFVARVPLGFPGVTDGMVGFARNSRRLHPHVEVAITHLRMEPTPAYRRPGDPARRDLGVVEVRINERTVLEAPAVLLMDEYLTTATLADLLGLRRALMEMVKLVPVGASGDPARDALEEAGRLAIEAHPQPMLGTMFTVQPMSHTDDFRYMAGPPGSWLTVIGIAKVALGA